MRKVIKSLFVLLMIASCTHKKSTDLKTFVESVENGLHKNVEAGEWVYSIQYKPADYIILQEKKGDISDTAFFKERMHSLEYTVWFNVGIKSKEGNVNPLKLNARDISEYNARLSYFLSAAGNNFKLIYKGQEMAQLGYFFENNYGLTPMDIMIVGFHIPDKEPMADLKLTYSDELFNNGIIKAVFSKNDIEEIPALTRL